MISGGVCDVTQPNSKTRRGRAQGNPPGTICPALMAHNSGGLVVMTEQQKEFADRLAIRKLIPEECFILQGMKKEDVEKCRAVGLSNSALFKIAGNGLIANVIQYIMEHIYKAVINHEYQTTDERMIASGYGV